MQGSKTTIPIRSYTLTLAIVLACAYLLDLINLPEKYYFDSNTIQAIAAGEVSAYQDKSYSAIASIVSNFQLHEYPDQSKLIFLCLFLAILHNFVMQNSIKDYNLLTVVLLTCLFAIGSVYFHMYTKEIIPLLLNTILLFTCQRTKRKILAIFVFISLIIIYAVTFRSYWILTISIFLLVKLIDAVHVSSKSKTKIKTFLFVVVVLVITKYNPGNLASIQNELNENRIGSEFANSALTNYPEYLPQALYWPYRIMALFFPFMLIQRLNIQSLVFALFLCLSTFLITARFYSFGRNDWRYDLFAKYLLSHFIVLSLFEPDYGSFVKHVTPFFVIFAFLFTKPVVDDSIIQRLKKVY